MPTRRRFTNDELNDIYDRTDGRCHLCHRKLSFVNYGANGERGAWHVEHSRPLARGGTHHLNNLYAACVWCNLNKGTVSTRTARSWAGERRAPLSRSKRASARDRNTLEGAVVGAGLGAVVGGQRGLLLGALFGAAVGYSRDPDA